MTQISLQTVIREILQKSMECTSLLVWYDPGGTLEPVLDELVPVGVELIRFQGSYLEIRMRIERSGEFRNPRIIYAPNRPLKPSWLRDYELFGEQLLLDLPELLFSNFGLEKKAELVSVLTPSNCRRLAQKWSEVLGKVRVPLEEQTIRGGLLAALFDQHSAFDVEEAVLRLLSFPEEFTQRLENSALGEIFLGELTRSGLMLKDVRDLRAIAAGILLAELVSKAPAKAILGLEGVIPEASSLKRWATVASRWATDSTYKASFKRWSQEVEHEYSIPEKIRGIQGIDDVGSFAAVDQVLLEEVAERISDGAVKSIRDNAAFLEKMAKTRIEKFWSREGLVTGWKPILKATVLCKILATAKKELAVAQPSGLRLLDRYFGDWWQIDALYREFAASERGLTGTTTTALRNPVNHEYQTWLDEVNTQLASAAGSSGKWPLDGYLLQSNFWQKFVNVKERTCLMFVDALRYELQRQLVDRLKDRGHAVNHTPMIACLPSATEVGMSALLPHTESIGLSYRDQKIELRLDGQLLASRKDREKWIEEHYKKQVVFAALDDLLSRDASILKQASTSQILIIWTTEIDAVGGSLTEDMLDYPDKVLEKVASAIEVLADLGFSRIVITADHGFLVVPDPQRAEVIQGFPKSGLAMARRYAVGHPPTVGSSVVFPLKKLGYDSEGEALFPKGLSLLPIPGEKAKYVHGGLSLQECCIGVIEIRPRQTAFRVQVGLEAQDKITTSMAKVRLIPKRTLTSVARRVVVETWSDKQRIDQRGPFEIGTEVVEQFLKVKGKQVEIRVVDADTNEILQKKSVPVVLEGYDEDL